MAHDPSRTEKATPKRREKAREEGNILRVQDLDSTLMFGANLFLFIGVWGATLTLMTQQVAYFFKCAGNGTHILDGDLGKLGIDLLWIVLRILLPYFAVNFLVAFAIQFVQHGFKPSFKPLQPKFKKLNPVNGFKRIFSMKSIVELSKGLFKLLIIFWAAYVVIGPKMPVMMQSMRISLNQGIALMQETLFQLYRNVLLAMLIIATIDFLYQRYQYEKNLKMTKQEIKDESKDAEGNPEIKGKQRSIMMQAAMRRIITQVPKATVVITNPTHFAVALKYDNSTPAPLCVAKGIDHMALKIRERATVSGVPIIENPPLARLLYRSVDIDRPIPADLYQAVAQILAYVYKLKGAA
ncbi:MAG: flagellar biosynthesis protein FlhB [Holophagales bacterium]|jgi:flagellar biosynthetic protein FlhB|nr:flagellar biosynthesis protein FlhB [Holophagales bacterium]